MAKAYFLGIDCGTTLVKATLMDENFRLIGEAKRSIQLLRPFPGASEVDMCLVWQMLCEVSRELADRHPQCMARTAGVCIAAQGDGLWAIDQKGEPVQNALLWNDTRTKAMGIEELPGLSDAVERNCTNQVYAGSIAALLKWTKQERPEVYRRIDRAAHCKDWLNYKLTGEFVTDYTDGSSCAFDLREGKLAVELLDILGIPESRRFFPEYLRSDQVLGKVTSDAAAQTGIPAGTKVVVGMIDVCAVPVGSDITQPGRCCAIIGTTLSTQVVLGASDGADLCARPGLMLHHAVPGMYMWLLPTLSGASCMDYMRDVLYDGMPYPQLEQMLEAVPPGCGGLVFHPYIYGERAPIKNPFAAGGFFGLTASHTRADMMRSVFEGLACSFYDCLRVFQGQPREVYFSGGASVSRFVCQMFTDIAGLPAHRVETREPGTLGVIRLMQVALGYRAGFGDFADQKTIDFTPDRRRNECYLELYGLFSSLQERMAPFWGDRARFLENYHHE
jgi:sugar (pentulose or hexulose) kinase